MRFSPQEIEAAIELHQLGLPWEPGPGQYVWDQAGLVEQHSPFQDGVYFILDLKHFLRRAGTLETLKRSMVWLPTWHDVRDVLEHLGLDHADVAQAIQNHHALEHKHELLTLYSLIAARLGTSSGRSELAAGGPWQGTRMCCAAE